MPLIEALPSLPELPIGGNITNGTIPLPDLSNLPVPSSILSLLTFCQTTFLLFSTWYIAWQNLMQPVKANEQHGLNIIATLNNRSKSVLDMEKGKDKMTSQTSSLIDEYEDIIFKVQALNNEPFLRRWIHTDAIAKRLRDLSAEGERLYQLYLVKVNLAIFVNSHHASNGVLKLQEQMERVLELLASKC